MIKNFSPFVDDEAVTADYLEADPLQWSGQY
jgi:hypothetical protein